MNGTILFSMALTLGAALASKPSGHPAPMLQDNQTILVLDPELIGAQFPNPEDIQKYWEVVGKPNPVLGEYYGLHVLQPVAKEVVARDFATPPPADGLENSMKLNIWGNASVTFHFNKQLAKADGTIVDSGHNYAWLQAPSVDSLLSLLDWFHLELKQSGHSSKYLLPNHHFGLETENMERLAASDHRVTLTEDPDLSKFRSAGFNVLLVVTDPVHGDLERYADILDIVQHEELEWFGIEMYTQNVHSTIDAFLSEPEGSPKFRAAKQKLLDVSWKNFQDQEESPEDNYYFRLIDICRRRRIGVYGMDIDILYDLFGHGETPFGAMVRNSFWSQTLPTSGRGVLFGGSMHFEGTDLIQGHPPLLVQDSLPPVYRGEKLLSFPSK
ncbi:hypothetical protein FQN54_005366 [Arachnomyces sp. PD_36]|nr:hypothetical protein FQN54_005366 [Arachnomyces sp. PD_36]